MAKKKGAAPAAGMDMEAFMADLQGLAGTPTVRKKQTVPRVDAQAPVPSSVPAPSGGTASKGKSAKGHISENAVGSRSRDIAADAPAAIFLPGASVRQGKSAPNSKLGQKASGDSEVDPSVAALIEAALKAKQAVRESADLTERVGEAMSQGRLSEFAQVFQPKQEAQPDDVFRSAESFGRTKQRIGPLKVAAYIRVSTDTSDQENSYETQERYFSRLLEQNPDWISAGIYSDYGISGTDGEKRTGFRRILRHCREGKIDRVVCKSISRFARNTTDFMVALRTLHDSGATILFEKENLDTADPTSDFILTTLGAIAQEESRSISGNIRWGMQKRFPKGDVRNELLYGYRYNGETVVTESGYKYKDIEIVEEEAEVVRRIFRMVADGESYPRIAQALNFDHIPPPVSPITRKRKKGAKKGQLKSSLEEGWTLNQVSQIAHSERYVGDVLIQKTFTEDYLTHTVKTNKGEVAQYYINDHHPAIVDRELYEQVQIIHGINASKYGKCGGVRAPRPFSQRLICADCGRYYTVRNTQTHPIWVCPSTTRNNGKAVCHAKKVYEEQIIRMFRRAVTERFGLTAVSLTDNVELADIMSGRYEMEESTAAMFTSAAGVFVTQMLARLETFQRTDSMERDRSFLKRQSAAVKMGIERMQKNIRLLQGRKETQETRKYVLGDTGVTDEMVSRTDRELMEETAKLEAGEGELKELEERLAYMERYWDELEDDYEEREKAIEWMKTLPPGNEGTVAFLNGMTDTYVKAFALSITIHSPLRYTVHWFDDTRTEVQMYTDIDDYRYTSDYFDGQRMRQKRGRR